MTIVLVTGVFDVLHEEHIRFLENARTCGDYLLIGIESDVRVTALKGPTRPVNSETKRKKQLEALGIAHKVVILPEKFSHPEDHRSFLQKYKPTILAVSEHSPHLREKQQLMKEIGGKVVVVHKHNPKISTTQLLQKKNSS